MRTDRIETFKTTPAKTTLLVKLTRRAKPARPSKSIIPIILAAFLILLLAGFAAKPVSAAPEEAWQSAYRSMIQNESYLREDSNTRYLERDMITFFLCDINADRIPELFVYSGSYTRGGCTWDVYTYTSAGTQYVGMAFGIAEEQDPSGQFPGLFLDEGNVGYGGYRYVELRNGTLYTESITERGIEGNTIWVTDNDALYAALQRMLAGHTEDEIYFGMIPAFTYESILEIGWDAFFTIYTINFSATSALRVSIYATGGEGLALKTQPDVNADRYFYLYDGTEVTIDQITADGWGHTTYNGTSGWLYLQYTRVIGSYAAEQPAGGYITPQTYRVVNTYGEGLELRIRPTTACSTFGPMYDGTEFLVEAISGNWAFGSCNGTYGWAYMDYLTPVYGAVVNNGGEVNNGYTNGSGTSASQTDAIRSQLCGLWAGPASGFEAEITMDRIITRDYYMGTDYMGTDDAIYREEVYTYSVQQIDATTYRITAVNIYDSSQTFVKYYYTDSPTALFPENPQHPYDCWTKFG